MNSRHTRSVSHVSSILMAVISALVALLIPAGYFFISYQYMGGSLDAEISLSVRDIEALVINNPKSWQYEELRLNELLEKRLRFEDNRRRLIRDLQGRVIAETEGPLPGPVRVFRQPIHDSGDVIAYIEVESPLAPLLLRTGVIGVFSILLGVAIFLFFRYLPLRAVRNVEEALRKSQEYFKAITESASDIVFIVDRKGLIKYATPSAERVLGYRPDELIGMTAFDLILPEDHPRAARDFGQALQTRDMAVQNSFPIRHKDGRELILEGTGKNLLHDPVISGFLMNVRDVTDRERAEEALRESEAKFRSLVENALEAILIAGLDGRIRFANRAAIRIVDLQEDYIGKNVFDFIAPESRDDVARDFVAVSEQRDGFLAEYFVLTARGRKVCVECIGKMISYEGSPADLVSIRDITERKQAEAEKAKLQEQLIQSRKMESVGRLAGGVAHDFNNMLGVIIGNTELALRKVDPAHPVHHRLRDIKSAAERSADLTSQLLAFARKQTIAPRIIDMNQAIEGMLKMLGRLIGEDIQLTWSPSAELWPVKIDPTQIDQILANLCVNARDAITGVGEIVIRTENIILEETQYAAHSEAEPGEYVLLSVRDSGVGMNREVLENLFEPFFTTKGFGQGTGLGLATVYGIVKQNNGFIDVSSEPDRGTVFTIYFPRFAGEDRQDLSGQVPEAIAGGRETVLVVEDEPSVLVMINHMLEDQGYRVLSAGTPAEAIRLADAHRGEIDLLVSDIIMPGMDGREMAETIASLCPKLKCLFMSGYTADVISTKGVLAEGVHFVQKPFTAGAIALKIRELLDQ